MNREAIMEALFARVQTAAQFRTASRRLQHWDKVSSQPAVFVVEAAEEYQGRPSGMPATPIVEAVIWIYSKAGSNPDAPPAAELNNLLDALEAVLAPTPVFNGVSVQNTQTLGGLVEHCWIEGRLDKHPGHLNGQAIAIVPIKMLVPQ